VTHAIVKADAIEFLHAQPVDSLDLVFGSPPYCEARTYGIDAVYDCVEWVEWMLTVTEAAHAACRGPVFWVAAGVTRDRNYWPACEGLMWEWWKRGGACQLYRPCAWHKIDKKGGGTGIPGSGQDDYLRADWEYVMCFKKPGKLFWSDNTAMGHTPKYARVGGEMSNRTQDGRRINEEAHAEGSKPWGDDPWNTASRGGSGIGGRSQNGEKKKGPKVMSNRGRDGKRKKNREMDVMHAPEGKDADGNLNGSEGKRPMPKIANPGNVIRARVGGGHMGNKLCHENEAPFPEKLPEFFILTFCPPGGKVCDPFSGSGTTACMAKRHGRNFTGCDLRQSQVDLGLKRLDQEPPLLFS
jgi:hypothetical protein